MSGPFDDVQRIVLDGGAWRVARHFLIGAGKPPRLCHFLNGLAAAGCGPTRSGDHGQAALQVSLGFTRGGLQNAAVPDHVLTLLGLRAPAFTAGAALRASRAGGGGASAPSLWDPAFDFLRLDLVLTLEAKTEPPLVAAAAAVGTLADQAGVSILETIETAWLPSPADEYHVHFGYRDRLSRIGIEGWTSDDEMQDLESFSRHRAGEFVLGHLQNTGANPWLSDGSGRVLPEKLRGFFRNGSFGVLHRMEQAVGEFEKFIKKAAADHHLSEDELRAKLCGRRADGSPLVRPEGTAPEKDFGYRGDEKGEACPFGSHMRRMAPRDDERAQTRQRPILRRGMPYGPAGTEGGDPRGLMGLFFCASIEDQFEHLLGQWAERVPLGSADQGGARDPLIGGHEPGDGAFHIPRGGGRVEIKGMSRFTRTRGTAYLFYPSLTTLQGIQRGEKFADLPDDK